MLAKGINEPLDGTVAILFECNNGFLKREEEYGPIVFTQRCCLTTKDEDVTKIIMKDEDSRRMNGTTTTNLDVCIRGTRWCCELCVYASVYICANVGVNMGVWSVRVAILCACEL
mmetsp:Transcript_20253/g.30121  ORF Transcript_20253/g.30121 Transcript_20253/m.30121 type:complete len:115 (+) Transcript_20253:78-422(+)